MCLFFTRREGIDDDDDRNRERERERESERARMCASDAYNCASTYTQHACDNF